MFVHRAFGLEPLDRVAHQRLQPGFGLGVDGLRREKRECVLMVLRQVDRVQVGLNKSGHALHGPSLDLFPGHARAQGSGQLLVCGEPAASQVAVLLLLHHGRNVPQHDLGGHGAHVVHTGRGHRHGDRFAALGRQHGAQGPAMALFGRHVKGRHDLAPVTLGPQVLQAHVQERVRGQPGNLRGPTVGVEDMAGVLGSQDHRVGQVVYERAVLLLCLGRGLGHVVGRTGVLERGDDAHGPAVRVLQCVRDTAQAPWALADHDLELDPMLSAVREGRLGRAVDRRPGLQEHVLPQGLAHGAEALSRHLKERVVRLHHPPVGIEHAQSCRAGAERGLLPCVRSRERARRHLDLVLRSERERRRGGAPHRTATCTTLLADYTAKTARGQPGA